MCYSVTLECRNMCTKTQNLSIEKHYNSKKSRTQVHCENWVGKIAVSFSLAFFIPVKHKRWAHTSASVWIHILQELSERFCMDIVCVCLSAPSLNPSVSSRLVRLSVGPHRDAHHRHRHSRVLPIYGPQAQSICMLWPSCFFILRLYSPLYLSATFCVFKHSQKTSNTSKSE